MVRLKTRVVTILLVCCILIAVMLFYFIIFLDDLQSLPPKDSWNKPLIIVPFTEVRKKNETQVFSASFAELMNKKVDLMQRNNHFNTIISSYENSNLRLRKMIDSLKSDLIVTSKEALKSPWKIASSWVRAREIIPEKAPELGFILKSLSKSQIVSADVAKKGTQLKLFLQLEGGQNALFKPMRYARDEIIPGIYDGYDRHNGEIVAFHLSRILNMRFVPIVASRRIHVENEIKKVASQKLLSTFVFKNNKSTNCFYGECYYCSEFDSICPDDDGFLEGAVVLLLPSQYHLQKLRSPWQRTYKEGVKAIWETDSNYCKSVLKKIPLRPRLLDLIDVSIFDFLIGNADRHHYEVFKDVPNSALLFLDNGKSFGTPFTDEITILAPLYQCCVVRNTTYQRLLLIASSHPLQLSDALEELLSIDELAPLITNQHLISLNRRIRTVLAVIHVCFDNNTKKDVLI